MSPHWCCSNANVSWLDPQFSVVYDPGWWFQPLWKIWKSVGMIIPYMMENEIHVWNHRPGSQICCWRSRQPVTGHCRSLSPRRPSDPRRCRTQQISHLRMEISGLQSGWCFLYSTPKAENWFKLSTILRQDSMCLFFLGVANIVYEFYDILCIPFTVIVGRYYCNWLQLYLGCKLNLVDCSFRTIKWQWWWGFIVFVIIIMIIIIIRYYPSKQPASLDLA